MKATQVHPFPAGFVLERLTRLLDKTVPEKLTFCPGTEPTGNSTYMLASISLLPRAPGMPPGVYQYEAGSPMVFGERVRPKPEKTATKSAVPQPLPNW